MLAGQVCGCAHFYWDFYYWPSHFPFYKISLKNKSGTQKRRDRRRRALARRQWFLHKSGKIALSVSSLIRVKNIFSKHHSRDQAFLRRISSEIVATMAAEEAYPWVCPCGRLNKKSSNLCVICWSHWTSGKKHDVTPKQPTYGSDKKWDSAWNDWDHGWESWSQQWDDAESVGRQSSQSPRGRAFPQEDYSPRGRNHKGKGKFKGKNKGKGKSDTNVSPFGPGSGSSAQLPSWPVWNPPETSVSPFQSAQPTKNSTMQEMAVHLRQAYKEKEAPADVQAFLDKAEKELSRNNIKSLQAATKSLDHAQKALRDAVQAKKEHRLQWTKHVADGIKIWEAQLENFRVHQAALSEQASKARAEIELSRKVLKEVSENSVKEGNLSIPQPIQEETEDASTDNAVDQEEQKLRDQLQGILKACAGSLGLQATEDQVQEVSDEERDSAPQQKRQRSAEPAKPGQTQMKS